MGAIENQNIEWKESWRDEYLKWICGFANAQGGTIYMGIDDTGKVVGVRNVKKLLDQWYFGGINSIGKEVQGNKASQSPNCSLKWHNDKAS